MIGDKPVLLDLFCCAGGASMGYYRAGFQPYGIDNKPQRHYPFPFLQMDAMEAMDRLLRGEGLTFSNGGCLYLSDFDVYHASPPCQPWGRMRKLNYAQGVARDYPELVNPIRKRLKETDKLYVIENTPGAPLIEPIMLCGSSFDLLVRRHRIFEMNFEVFGQPCAHNREVQDKPPLHRLTGKSRVVGCYGHGRGKGDNKALWSKAMGITWMTRTELSQAIPPAYTHFIGNQTIQIIK